MAPETDKVSARARLAFASRPNDPAGSDPALPIRKASFRAVVWAMLFGAPVVCIALVVTGQSFRLLIAAPFVVVGIVALLLLRSGRFREAVRFGLYGTWLSTLFALVLLNGVKGPSASILPVIILISGWLGGVRETKIVTCATVVALLLMAHAMSSGWPLPVRYEATPYYAGVLLAAVMAIAGMLGAYMHRALEEQLGALQ